MSKTYSVAIKVHDERGDYWVTNWGQYASLDDIDFEKVRQLIDANPTRDIGYGYYYGANSRNLKSARCRTVLFER